ncbi:helix-turn-helix domain-containing protein [Hymenobacter sp. 5317J-9]|uniref:helix-turn-helix domain-containing protein n=1 Tax=Hymenobacter sp. 5317J-9 TaxID=2932250 RepID=UPI001FD715C1|nr:helix-turn-helix domain-containing protein [Hymenobacter sp. 5317J-9]UOQ97813.1 helix-turn-helix domain-containing protein [Hymenobacter sp. 5317J-9]
MSEFSGTRILALRKSKGLSQEVLAEQSGVSLRTIQRVEQGATVPRGHTVLALAAALSVPLEALHAPTELPAPAPAPVHEHAPLAPGPAPIEPSATIPTLHSDPEFLQLLNLSALSFLVLPLLNLVVPWLLWRSRRHRTAHVAELGRRVLGFQALWQVGTFFLMLLALAAQLVVYRHYHVALPELWLTALIGTYAANVATVLYYSAQLRRGNFDVYRYRL